MVCSLMVCPSQQELAANAPRIAGSDSTRARALVKLLRDEGFSLHSRAYTRARAVLITCPLSQTRALFAAPRRDLAVRAASSSCLTLAGHALNDHSRDMRSTTADKRKARWSSPRAAATSARPPTHHMVPNGSFSSWWMDRDSFQVAAALSRSPSPSSALARLSRKRAVLGSSCSDRPNSTQSPKI